MATLADAYVRLRADDRRLGPEVKKEGEKHGRVFGATFARSTAGPFRAVGGILTRSIGGVVTGLAAVAGIRAFAGFISDAEDSAKVAKLTESTIRATGKAAKVTAKQVGDLATAISNKTGKDDEAIQSGQNMLLTFKGIRNEAGRNNDIFNQASSVLTDMVAAMNGGVVSEENMRKGGIQLGKALNDPVKGITALTRVGVTFTDKQKEQIKAMVDAGNTAGAQKIILAELSSEFGGAAAASSSMSDRMKVALGNLGETIGGLLLPLVDKFSKFVANKLVPGLQAAVAAFQEGDITSDGFVGGMERVGVAARKAFDYFKSNVLPRLKEFGTFIRDTVIPAVGDLVGWLWRNRDVVVAVAAAYATVKLALFAQDTYLAVKAVRAMIIAQGGLNLVMKANLFGIVVVALAALVAGIIIAYKHSETFRNIVQAAWKGIQTAVSFAWNNVIKPTIDFLVAAFRNVLAPTVLWLWHNIFQPAWAVIGRIVQAAWVVIQIVFALMRIYIQKVLAPVILWLWHNVVEPVFRGIGVVIKTAWEKVIRPIFDALGGFIKKYVAPPFSKGVEAIGKAWDGLKKAAAAPVKFVIDTVINKGIIAGINWVASKVGVKDRIPPIPLPAGLSGGLSGTSPAHRDVLSGNVRGDGPGIGDGFGDLLKVFTGPAKFIADRMHLGDIARKFGNNPLTHVLAGAGNKLKGFAIDKLKSLLNFFDGGKGGVSASGLQAGILSVLGSLRSTFGNVPVISGFRRGARTLSGNVSYHSMGRAIDIAPVLAWARFLNAAYGSRLRELITPWNDLNILNGSPHRYTGAVWNQHNFPGGNAHIHAAMANGGIIREPVFGVGASGRTYSFGERGPETVTPGVGGGSVHFHFHGTVADEKAAEDMIVKGWTSAVRKRRIRLP